MYCVFDVETLRGMFLYVAKDLNTGKKFIFRIDRYQNDLQALVCHLREELFEYYVSFNGLSFDCQVIQYILTNCHKWVDLPGLKVAAIIYQFAQDRIDDARYKLPAPFKEWKLWAKQVDLFKIHHFDNKSRRCSLKWAEYSMDFSSIEEMPIDHSRADLSPAEIENIISYCINDVEATEQLFLITRGLTELEEYAGKDKIQDRFDLIEEYGLPYTAMNWSDVRIGDELNKLEYSKLTGLSYYQIEELKANRRSNAGFTFGDCIPGYIRFQTKELQEFHQLVSGTRVNLKDNKQGFQVKIGETEYTIKKGGIHSNDKKRMVVTGAGQLMIDADVGSQYPSAIVKRGLYPSHLGQKWLGNYQRTIARRLEYKKLSQDKSLTRDQRRKYKGLAESLKLALNGGGFGKTNETNNWQYDPFVHFSCTVGNQFEMLMLIEALELAGIHVISANTDGIVSLLSKEKEPEYYRICKEWENTVGNTEMGKLEFTEYAKLIQTSVSDYLAVKASGEIKKKGDFATTSEIHKNKSRRIIPIAMEQYFIKGTPVEDTIRNHPNLFDYTIGVRANKDYHYEAINPKTAAARKYDRVVRYYVSISGEKLMKVACNAVPNSQKGRLQCEAGYWLSTVINRCENVDAGKAGINYDYYIAKCREIINGLENPIPVKKNRARSVKSSPNQLSIF